MPAGAAFSCDFKPSTKLPPETEDRLLRGLPTVYADISRRLSVSPRVLLGRLLDDYYESSYSEEELKSVLESFSAELAGADAEIRSKGVLRKGEPECDSPRGAHGSKLVLYVDPLCSHCRNVSERLDRLSKSCPDLFSAIIFRPLPSREVSSIKACAQLELVKERRPALYCSAIKSFMQAGIVQGGIESAWETFQSELEKSELDLLPVIRARLEEDLAGSFSRQYSAPILILGNVHIRPLFAFDALGSDLNLFYAITFINALGRPAN